MQDKCHAERPKAGFGFGGGTDRIPSGLTWGERRINYYLGRLTPAFKVFIQN